MSVKPNTPYYWDQNALFELSGSDLQLLVNGFRTILSTPEAQKILLTAEMSKAVEAILAKGVEDGIVKEGEPTPLPSPLQKV